MLYVVKYVCVHVHVCIQVQVFCMYTCSTCTCTSICILNMLYINFVQYVLPLHHLEPDDPNPSPPMTDMPTSAGTDTGTQG